MPRCKATENGHQPAGSGVCAQRGQVPGSEAYSPYAVATRDEGNAARQIPCALSRGDGRFSATCSITGIGWVTASGMGCGKDRDDFAFTIGSLPTIRQGQLFDRPFQSFRRMDAYSKVGIAAIALALKDAGLDRWTRKRNIGVIVSTEYGCLDVDLEFYESVLREQGIGASPALFAYTLPNSFLGDAAILFGLTGKALVVNESRPLGLAGLKLAMDSLALGECDRILCGVNNPKTPPFDKSGKALPGALFFVIEKSPRGSASPYGELIMERGGVIRFERRELGDLGELAEHCLARRRPSAPA